MKTIFHITLYSLLIACIVCVIKIYEKEKNKKPLIQTVQIIQAADTAVYTGVINETQYYIKIFDTTGSIKTQYMGDFKINYIKSANK